jgi:hypothetical protein
MGFWSNDAPKQKYGTLGVRSEFKFSPSGYTCIVTGVSNGAYGKLVITYKIKGGDGGTASMDVYPTESCYL